jgi:hypothetical protein
VSTIVLAGAAVTAFVLPARKGAEPTAEQLAGAHR